MHHEHDLPIYTISMVLLKWPLKLPNLIN